MALKLLIMGYAGHGKDTVADILLHKYGLRYISSSMFCAKHIILPKMRDINLEDFKNRRPKSFPDYKNFWQCYKDRNNYRPFWYNTIKDYNTPDKTCLGKAIFKDFQIYCGLRNSEEFEALKNNGIFTHSVWVDSSKRGIKPESVASCTVKPSLCQYCIDNSSTLKALEIEVEKFYNLVIKESLK